jgi:Type II secretion system (T2SS), protein N
MSLKSAILLMAAIFVITVLVRLPAGVLPLLLPASVHCQSPSGTLWQGSCRELGSGTLALSDVRWTLHPLALLRAHLLLDLQSDDARAAGQAQLALHGNGDLQIQGLNATLPLQGGLSALPPGWSGALQLAIDQASVQGGKLTAMAGTITARQLHSENPPAELGSFQLQFPSRDGTGAATPIMGTLRDLEGPLSLQGQLQLLSTGAYELSGTVAARDSSSADLRQMLQLLGPPDAQGRHTFSLAGTL